MTPLFILLWMATLWAECRTQGDNVLQPKAEEMAAEDQTVTLDCQYTSTRSDVYIFWYKQDGTSKPKFILSCSSFSPGKPENEFMERFSSTLNSTTKSAPLKIQKLQLSDSAVYYCALKPAPVYGGRLLFGRGVKVTVRDRNQYQPSFYKLENGNNSVCLATGFSQFRQLGNHSLFNQTEAVRISQDSLFNQVAFMTSGTNLEDCEEDAGGPTRCDDALQPDPMVNLVSLVVTGLRVLLLKTVIFNILMTLRLQFSQ